MADEACGCTVEGFAGQLCYPVVNEWWVAVGVSGSGHAAPTFVKCMGVGPGPLPQRRCCVGA